ncbi:serine/arginine-rich splicing factor SR45-like protein [Lates japonicus]|uniref:Serine/arginine-rich splicing factor SR45-like protein n=1 Tax=Lates japonicus TaxID=270547 RepID=A0AAD3R0A0_LATJO|nr:serine/arginine-rich splicing factor SR45-like protein [Lates japonicus]
MLWRGHPGRPLNPRPLPGGLQTPAPRPSRSPSTCLGPRPLPGLTFSLNPTQGPARSNWTEPRSQGPLPGLPAPRPNPGPQHEQLVPGRSGASGSPAPRPNPRDPSTTGPRALPGLPGPQTQQELARATGPRRPQGPGAQPQTQQGPSCRQTGLRCSQGTPPRTPRPQTQWGCGRQLDCSAPGPGLIQARPRHETPTLALHHPSPGSFSAHRPPTLAPGLGQTPPGRAQAAPPPPGASLNPRPDLRPPISHPPGTQRTSRTCVPTLKHPFPCNGTTQTLAPGTLKKRLHAPGTPKDLARYSQKVPCPWYSQKGGRELGWARPGQGSFGLVPPPPPDGGGAGLFFFFTQSKSRRPWYSGSRRGATTIRPHPSPFTNGSAHRPKPAIRGQPKIRSAMVSVLPELALGHRLTGVPPQSNSPPATVPGAGHARRGRLLDARSESPLGARLTGRIPLVRTSSKSAARRQPRRPAGGPRERVPAGAVAGEIREKGPARVQSRRRRPPYPVPSTGPPSTRRRTPPRENPRPATREAPRTRAPRGGPRTALPAAERGGRRGDCSPSRGSSPAPLRTPARPTQPLEPILIPKLRI